MSAGTRLLATVCILAICACCQLSNADLLTPQTLPEAEPTRSKYRQQAAKIISEQPLTYQEPKKREVSCAHLAQDFLRTHGTHPSPESDPKLMLYFLHIPRTAGRTYHSCYLKLAHPPSRRCAKSYDELRLDQSVSGCGLLSSHDDYSVVELLPKNSALITQLREPVDRFLSAYEFATEVAARAARHAPPPHDPSRINTRDVWPWSYMVPFMENDIQTRLRVAVQTATDEPRPDAPVDPYDNEVVMPLADFVEHPEVQDVLHNGATLQVLGLTNYSRWPGAADLRRCIPNSPVAQELLLEAALKRLETFVHVGLFDRLHDSIASLAATLGVQLEGPAWEGSVTEPFKPRSTDPAWMNERLANVTADHAKATANLDTARRQLADKIDAGSDADAVAKAQGSIAIFQRRIAQMEQEQAMLRSHLSPDKPFSWQSGWDDAYKTRWPLWRSYHQCVDRARQRNTQRRQSSFKNLELPDGRKVQFSHEARKTIDPAILDRIRQLNAMDAKLYEKGQQLLEARLEQQRAKGLLEVLGSKEAANLEEIHKRESAMFAPRAAGPPADHHRAGARQVLKGQPQPHAEPIVKQDDQVQKPASDHQEL